MHTIAFIQDLAVIMLAAGIVTVLFHLLRQPVVLGYIAAGVLIGPHTPPYTLVNDEQSISTVAELGLIFLLFALGLEFSLRHLRRVGATAVVAALAGIVTMLWLGYELGLAFGWSNMDALFLGRLRDFVPGPRFRVEAVAARPTGLVLQGATPRDRDLMRDWRGRLSELMGFRHPNHDTYQFHLTFAYPVSWLDDAELPAWQALFEEVLADIRARDERDSTRDIAPLRPAADAIVLDTSALDVGDAVAEAVRLAEERVAA